MPIALSEGSVKSVSRMEDMKYDEAWMPHKAAMMPMPTARTRRRGMCICMSPLLEAVLLRVVAQ